MSFRARLTLFFVLIVIVPMLSVAIVLFRLIADNETGKADASVAARQRSAINLYNDARGEADKAVRGVGSDEALALALRAGNAGPARVRAQALLKRDGVRRIVITGGKVAVDVGSQAAIAPAVRDLVGQGSESFGRLEVSVTLASEYADLVKRITGADVVVTEGARVLATTLPQVKAAIQLPPPGEPQDIDVSGDQFRAVTFTATGFKQREVRIALLSDDARRQDAISRSRLLAAGILLGFLVLAMTFAVAVSRSLQAQIGSFLAAARRIASGDFSTEVTTSGRDEFAELGEEFNKMSRQLEERLEDLRQERARLQTSLRRIGQSFASNLDSDALLEIVVRTAVDGLGAGGGRATARDGSVDGLEELVRAGTIDAGPMEALTQAEAAAMSAGDGSEATAGEAYALAHPLSGEAPGEVVGIVSVVREGQPFSDRDRELLAYLAGTASVSIQNVGLHETVQRQAVTDELTGLYNHRRFQEAMVAESDRARRFDQPMSLVMLDIDNFKKVNDNYGHQQGDQVLREVARVLRESSREIDSPARYGGEELAVVLPQTDLEGAFQLAERVRQEVEAMQVPMVDGAGGAISVTASLGVASLPESAPEPGELIAAADAALYQAKNAGKNQTVRAAGKV
ncbi:MAG: diguanylate cyclase [Solirubrobacterales bacterium]|nr:diguanylate cyclase [Solirubrobacterales bacterium]